MATAAVCPRFSQNAWRREMCSNCFRTRNEHPAAPTRQPVVLPSKYATPKQSILKGAGRAAAGRKAGSVCFHKTEAEVIGYDGGDAYTDFEDENDTITPVNGHDAEPLYPEPSEEEEKAIQSLTRRNTDFNSENANLLKATAPPPPATKAGPPRAELGRKTTSAPIVCVTPFGAKPEVTATKTVVSFSENKPKPEIVPQNIVNQEIVPQNTAKQENFSQNILKQENLSLNTEKQENFSQNIVKQENFSQNIVKQENFSQNIPKQETVSQNTAKVTLNNELNLAKAQPSIKVTPRTKSTTEIIQNTKIIISNVNGTDKITPVNSPVLSSPVVKLNVLPSPAVNFNSVQLNPKVTPAKQNISTKAPETPQHKTDERERPVAPHTERRPPLGHESSSAPLSAPALVKLQVKEVINDKPPAFLRHKDSVDLISPPASPRLINRMISPPSSPKLAAKQEERPPPIGKVSSKLTVTLKSPTSPEVAGRRKLVEARSSALIRRWTVGERVLVQPRRPVLDAPEIVPLTLQSASKASSHLGLESRELAGEPDGEDAKTTMEPNPVMTTTKLEPKLANEQFLKNEIVGTIVLDNRVEDFIEIRVKSADQPPTPPSSPLPEEETPPPVVKRDDTPPCLPASPPPTLQRPTSLPVVSPRTSFLHGALTGRPQVPAKPATLLASLPAAAKRHAIPVAVSTPQLPTPPPDTVKEEMKSEQKVCEVVSTPPSTPEAVTEPPIYDTPKNIEVSTPLTANKPPFSSGKPPKMGSYKKRQAPKPPGTPLTCDTPVEVFKTAVTPVEVGISVEKTSPVEHISNKCHVRTASQESFEELSRRDSLINLEKSPPNKKNNARFSLRRLLRLGVGRDERATSPESPNSSPSPPGSPPVRPEIIHPSMLDGRQVQVVSRIQGVQQSPPLPAAVTPTGRPRPPPPPPRTLSLGSGRPSRPPPPQSVTLLQMREKAQDNVDDMLDDDHAVYANLKSVQRRSPSKPERSGSMRESSPECDQPASLTMEDSDYETVAFSDGRLSRRRRSAVMGSLEESYGAVVGANHRALAQLLASLCAAPLPSQCSSTVLEKFASEEEGDETRGLVLLQMLAALKDITDNGVMATNLAEFIVLKPVDPQLSNIGPRLKHITEEVISSPESPLEVGAKACRLLLPSEHKLPDIIKSAGLIEARSFLELRLWGPELTENEREVALQRWLDLERATALQSLALYTTRLPLSQEMYTNFLVQASAIRLARAANL